MEFEKEKRCRNDLYPMILIGCIAAFSIFGYGLYGFVVGQCTVIGRGNPPIGTFLTLYDTDARLVSFIYTGTGIFLFAHFLVRNIPLVNLSKSLSWIGVVSILFGLCSLMMIMLLPLLG